MLEYVFNDPNDRQMYDKTGRRVGGKRKSILYTINENGCWVCTSHKHNGSGYPTLFRAGKYMSVPRYSLMLSAPLKFYGRLEVMHSCDNPTCINPDHLSWGSRQDNEDDKKAKGRTNKGESVPSSVLTKAKVIELRRYARSNNVTYEELSSLFGYSKMTVFRAVTGRTWSHVVEGSI